MIPDIALFGGGIGVLVALVLVPIIFKQSSLYQYAYANAKIRAMRARLVTTAQIDELLQKPYHDILFELEKHHVPELSGQIGSDLSSGAVEAALKTNLVKTAVKVLRIAPEELKPFIKILLSKYDILIIESIIRSHKTTIKFSKDTLHTTEVFTREFITKKEHTLEDLQQELANTPYAQILAKYAEQVRKGEYKAFETEMDLLFFKRLLLAASVPEAKEYAQKLIDIHNISLLLKQEDALIPGGKIPLAKINPKPTITELKSLLEQYRYTSNGTPEQVERGMQKNLYGYGLSLFSKQPLSAAPIIGYFILKTQNIRSLTILLKLKSHSFDTEEIKEVLAL